jgi:hypothetical protein
MLDPLKIEQWQQRVKSELGIELTRQQGLKILAEWNKLSPVAKRAILAVAQQRDHPPGIFCRRCGKELLPDTMFFDTTPEGHPNLDEPICVACYNADQVREDESYRLWAEGKLWGKSQEGPSAGPS